METRPAEIEKRTDLDLKRLSSVRRSRMTLREFLQEIKLYEAKHARQNPAVPL